MSDSITMADLMRMLDELPDGPPPEPIMECRCGAVKPFSMCLPPARFPGTVRCPSCRREMARKEG
jgi:hypothetical protein